MKHGCQMDVRDALAERLTKRVVRMREMLDRFDDATAEGAMVGPNWNVRDLVAHFAHWTGEAAARIPELARGVASKEYDIDRINDDVLQKNRGMRFTMLRPQLREAEERLSRAVRSVPLALLLDSEVRKCVETTIAHYDQHRRSLDNALSRLD